MNKAKRVETEKIKRGSVQRVRNGVPISKNKARKRSKSASAKPRLPKPRPYVAAVCVSDEKSGETARPANNLNVSDDVMAFPESAETCFEWLIHPIMPQQFFNDIWEKKPFLVKRRYPGYYQGLLSCDEIHKILRNNMLNFGEHLDVTSYVDGQRLTHNPSGGQRAYPAVVWDYFQNGCSIRLLSPQTHSNNLWKVNSLLQTFFGSFVGANAYLTPKGTQGFAPHFDDIEAFILQLEGKKQWKVYPPRNESETLPRLSSPNFSPDEIGDAILSVELEPGDLLYFPRGFIHQAKSNDNVHSLHVTLSTYQKNTWGDFFTQLIPQALQSAMENDVDFRRSLPIGYLNYMGVAHSEIENESRNSFLLKVRHLFSKLLSHSSVDGASDQMGKQFLNDSMPLKLSATEKARSIHGNGDHWSNGCLVTKSDLTSKSKIRLLNPNALRLVMEEEEVRVYHSMENTRTYREAEPKHVLIGAELAPAVEHLIHVWPKYVAVETLPMHDEQDKMEIVGILYDKGLLMTKKPID